MAPDRELCALLCPMWAARAEVPALPYQILAFWWSVHHFPECQTFLHHSTLPNTISSPSLKTVFLGMGLIGSKYKRASYTLLARKWLTLSLTYIAEVNQWNVLHRLRKICFICSSANNNQILWGKKNVTSVDLWLGAHSQLKKASSWPRRIQFWKITNHVVATELSECILMYLFENKPHQNPSFLCFVYCFSLKMLP